MHELGVYVVLCSPAAAAQNYLLENSSDHVGFVIKLDDKKAGVASLSIAGHLIQDPFSTTKDLLFF